MKLGTTELIVILVIVLLIFGPTQIPKLTKMFGKSVKSFKDGMDEEDKSSVKETTAKKDSDTADE
ncbi:MAG: twin-arginine translocase TatA/TatE family subunit [Lachnospiraceae bacterium]|nr:twin-arginine translocase TatA/TatE family subunit [Lachnospiraceae bacterium]